MEVVERKVEGTTKHPESKADILIHPVRLRIVLLLGGGRRLTAQQIAAHLPGEAQTTLYRHLSKLVALGALEVVETHAVRGTMEKVYALNAEQTLLRAEDVADATPDEHLRHFTVFLAELMSGFECYLRAAPVVNPRDFGFWQEGVYLTDAEYSALGAALLSVVQGAGATTPTPGRRRINLSVVAMPASDGLDESETNRAAPDAGHAADTSAQSQPEADAP